MDAEHNALKLRLQRDAVASKLFGTPSRALRIGRYRVEGTLGEGGMGTVLHAHDETLGRDVALKALHRGDDAHHVQRLRREARALARLEHPNVVRVFDVSEIDGRTYMVMELVRGQSLRQWQQGPRPWSEVLDAYLQAGRGLAAAHRLGLVHRDFKPANCMLDEDGVVKVLDFGLVSDGRDLTELPSTVDDERPSPGSESATGGPLTRAGAVLGTIAYMAPEQLRGEPADAASDLFAYCVSLYEALHGHRPFPGNAPAALLTAMEGRVPPSPPGAAGTTTSPTWLRDVVHRGLALEPRERPPTMDALLDAIERRLLRRRRVRLVAVATVVLGGAALLGATVAPSSPPSCDPDPSALVGTWGDDERRAVRRAFESTGLGFAETSLAATEQRLDAWSESWRTAGRRACEATRITGSQSEAMLDRRTACLDRQRRRMGSVVDVLASADAPVVGRVDEVLRLLPPVRACDDVELLGDDDLAGLGDPRLRATIEAGERAVIEARAWLYTHGPAASRDRLEALARDHGNVGHPPLSLDIDAIRGEAALLADDYHEAVPALLEVAREAEGLGLDERVAAVRTRLARGVAGEWSRPEQEHWLLADAEAAVRRRGLADDPRERVLLETKAMLRCSEGDHEGALAIYQQVAARSAPLPIAETASPIELRIANELADLGRFDEARSHYRDALQLARERYGDGSPAMADVWLAQGLLALDRGDPEAARGPLQRAHDAYLRLEGAEGLSVVRARFGQAKLAMITGELGRARALVDEVLATARARLGPRHALTGEALGARGVLQHFDGDFEGAIRSYEEALAVQRRLLGEEHEELAVLHSNLGEALLELDALERARASFERAIGTLARTPEHPRLALPYKGRGLAHLRSGDPARARQDLEHALAIHETSGGEPIETAEIRFALARAIASSEPGSARAAPLAREARASFEALGMSERLDAVDAWLNTSTTPQREPP